MSKWWPLGGLRLRTPRLELRPASDSDLDALADLAAAGVHDPAVQPFTFPWTDVPPDEFAILREVSTGSWLGREYQGEGTGTEMRAAVLHLAFAGLGAEYAVSGAFSDNPASQAVSRKLGYAADGVERHVSRGRPAIVQPLRLGRQAWQATQAIP